MKKLLIMVFIIGLSGVLWFLVSRNQATLVPEEKTPMAAPESPSKSVSKPDSSSGVSKALNLPSGKYPRWEGTRSTGLGDPRWKILNQRDKADRAWMGKVEIEFYGKVVDENGQPVEGALVHFSKGDLSEAGTTQLERRSDVNGRVSLIGVLGRGMSARAEKPGYYSSRLDRHYFEYALFSDENFYQPDSSNPVIFHLRKKEETDPLIYRERELKVGIGAASEVTLDLGVKLKIELLANPRPRQGQWSMLVTVLSGGLQIADEGFQFAAPVGGYQPNLTLSDSTPKPPGWIEIYEGGTFYLQSGSNYGRIEIQMISGKDWIRIKSWLNPSGSRNLEFDPTKVVKPQP